jgi:hypothetical protein
VEGNMRVHDIATSGQPAQHTDSPSGRQVEGHEREVAKAEEPRQPRLPSPAAPYLCHDADRHVQLAAAGSRQLQQP